MNKDEIMEEINYLLELPRTDLVQDKLNYLYGLLGDDTIESPFYSY